MRQIVLILFLLTTMSIFAQNERRNHFGIRADITANYGLDVKDPFYCKQNIGMGGSINGTYKFYLKKNAGWYIEPEVSLFYSVLQYTWEGWFFWDADSNSREKKNQYQEFGIGTSAIFGYDFKIGRKTSLELFTGPDFRYSLYRGFVSNELNNQMEGVDLYRVAQFRWRIGVGVNHRSFNYSLSISPDITWHQHLGVDKKYMNLSLGVGYNF